EDGTKIVTIRDANGRVLRRIREFADGSRVVLFDDTEVAEPVDIASLPEAREQAIVVDTTDEDALRRALSEAQARDVGRTFSLNQVRQIRKVRELAPELDLEAVTFATGSAAIQPSQAEELTSLGRAMSAIISERPGEVFLIEGHTDAVGSATYNLALSDRRAETVALALSEYFDVPPENMITQGYGESALKIPTLDAERANRRATIRRITPLLRQAVLDN
ncbi:MAG: OmpA family protein, partial [Boseongicola sp.]|nr:OmpA family protein [Boseongicola sp.]